MQEKITGRSIIFRSPPIIVFEQAENTGVGEFGPNVFIYNRILNHTRDAKKILKKKRKPSKKKAKIFMRDCSRCGKVYWTIAKYGTICDDCKKPYLNGEGIGFNEVNKK